MPLCSMDFKAMASLSPCSRATPTMTAFLGISLLPTRMASNSLNLTACPSVTVWLPCMQAEIVFLSEIPPLPMAVLNLAEAFSG